LGYLFNNSIVTKSSISGDASVGKQLIYNPQHKFTTSIYGQYKSFNLLFGSIYTGDVFARTDNSALSTLEHFNVLNAQASYILKLKKSSFELHIAVLNFTNENYQTIKNYPMPGINFTTGITLTI
jgi:vitamin B12 transporter